MKFQTFAQFLLEKEKMVQLYGTSAKGQSPGQAIASVVNPAKPAKPVAQTYNGLYFPSVYAQKKRNSGVLGNT